MDLLRPLCSAPRVVLHSGGFLRNFIVHYYDVYVNRAVFPFCPDLGIATYIRMMYTEAGGTMRRTQIYLDEQTVREVEQIRERFRLSSNSDAIRFAVREYTALLARQDARERRRSEREEGRS